MSQRKRKSLFAAISSLHPYEPGASAYGVGHRALTHSLLSRGRQGAHSYPDRPTATAYCVCARVCEMDGWMMETNGQTGHLVDFPSVTLFARNTLFLQLLLALFWLQ